MGRGNAGASRHDVPHSPRRQWPARRGAAAVAARCRHGRDMAAGGGRDRRGGSDAREPVERRRGGAPVPPRRGGRGCADDQPALYERAVPIRGRGASAGSAPGARHPRSLRACAGGRARRAALARPWPLGCARTAGAGGAGSRDRRGLRLPSRGGPAAAPDPGRPRARRHHRARPLPLLVQRRDGGAAGRAAGLCAQGAWMA